MLLIAVIGLGFVGLTTALGFAHKGYKVYGFDVDVERRNSLSHGDIPFHEPFLDEFLGKYTNKTFFVCSTLEEAIINANVIFYCVGTPSCTDGEVNLQFLNNAIMDSVKFIKKEHYKTLVIKSTVPPSTTHKTIKPLIENSGFRVGKDIGLSNNPEFLREGFAWKDFCNPDRIVIGENDKKSGELVEELYHSFEAPIFRVSLNTAEFIKYLSNSLLSTLISFSNEMSMVADAIGDIDISNSFRVLHLDRRWFGMPAKMTSYVYPGCGFGGYCLPKDTLAIYNMVKNKGYEPFLLKEVLSVNDRIKRHIVDKIANSTTQNKYIGILGLSFKPESDDVRDTPAKDIINTLIKMGFNKIIAYDPIAVNNFKKLYNLPILYTNIFEEVTQKCDVIVILTAWEEFKEKKKVLECKKIIDGRYFL